MADENKNSSNIIPEKVDGITSPINKEAPSMPNNNKLIRSNRKNTRRVINKVRNIFKDKGENFEDGDEKLLASNPPQKPSFPYIIMMLAISKDLIDIPGDLSGIGIIATTAFSFVISLVLFMWVLGKLGGGWWKKKIIRWLWKRYVYTIILEFIPGFQIIPATTIFVFMAYHHEKKIVKLLNLALEEFRNAKIFRHIK